MDLKEAQKVVSEYGGFLECANERFGAIFFTHIPQSLLPFPPEHIEEALNVVAKFYHEKGDMGKVRLHQEVMAELMCFKSDEDALLQAIKMFNDKKFWDFVMESVKNFRSSPAQTNYISGFFTDVPFEKIDFEKLDISTAHKIVKIYGIFLKNAHMRLSFIFNQKIPESFLPFSKYQLGKALEFYSKVYGSFGDDENAEVYASGKTILEEDYVEDEIAMNELLKNLSDKEARDSIISDIKEFQLKSARLNYIDLLGLNKK